MKRWKVVDPCPATFAIESGIRSPIVAQLLWARSVRQPDEIATFLDPSWETGIHEPSQFRHMAAAVDRIFQALEKGERITVHGDYDADGITGSALLITTLREIEGRLQPPRSPLSGGSSADSPPDKEGLGEVSLIDHYIPHRDKEGYGLHRETVPKLQARGTTVMITVDCGIACVDEIALARQSGIDTIVVDHHQFGDVLPDGHLIHPGLPEETYPFKSLAAVGVAYKFACALIEEARRRTLDIPVGWEKWLLDLVAIATVTDMVPLVGENRVLQTFGLRVLNKTRRIGLRALIKSAGLEFGKMDTESVGFAIGPRLNAAGRMDHAELALRLLLEENEEEARSLAQELERCNRERQDAVRKMMAEAEGKIDIRHSSLDISSCIILWDKDWSPSLVGLVAGRFVDRFARPVIVIGQHAGKWIGSGRSINGYNITEAMREAGEGILTRVGGHPQACGFALEDEGQLTLLQERLINHASARLSPEQMVPTLEIDAEIPLASINEDLMRAIDQLEPFGEGNRRPVFLSSRCSVASADTMGATGQHLRLTLITEDGRRIKAVAFKNGSRREEITIGSPIDIVYHVTRNEWNGRSSIECHLVDFRLSAI